MNETMTTADAEREARERAEKLLEPCTYSTSSGADFPGLDRQRMLNRLTAAFLSDARERDELRVELDALKRCETCDDDGLIYNDDDEPSMCPACDALTKATTELAEARARAEAAEAALKRVYAFHCECRPLRFDRKTYGHSHDCDEVITDDIEAALSAPTAVPTEPGGGR